MDEANRNAHAMKTACGDHKTHAVEQSALSCWEFRTVCVAVENREKTDKKCGYYQFWADLAKHHCSQKDCGQGDTDLDTRQRDSEQPHHGANRHDHGE